MSDIKLFSQAGVLVQECRIALVSFAVTGKMDMRSWTAPV